MRLNKKILNLSILSLAFVLAGCANALNPYSSKFQCPHVYKGQCVSLQEAYQKSKTNTDGDPKLLKPKNKQTDQHSASNDSCPNCAEVPPAKAPADLSYKTSLYNKLKGLLKSPKTPVVVPPKVIRVLILPYKTANGDLEMSRYVYFFATKPGWSLTPAEVK